MPTKNQLVLVACLLALYPLLSHKGTGSKLLTAATALVAPMKSLGSGQLTTPIHENRPPNQVNTLQGKPFDFAKLKGKVVLVTNVACACGYTSSNYEGLLKLLKDYPELHILAFPSNEFGKQESGSPQEILAFVQDKGVDVANPDTRFHMMEKIETNGKRQHPIYAALKQATGTQDVDVVWNFETKFLIGKDGARVERYSKAFTPDKLRANIEAAIGFRSDL